MYPHKVKIVRNYKSKDEKIQKDVPAYIQSELSYFDDDADIKRGDYVFVPDLDEPQIVEKVEVRPRGIGVYVKEIKLRPESAVLGKKQKSGITLQKDIPEIH